MTPLLLALGVYCHLMVAAVCTANPRDPEDGRLIDNFLALNLAGIIYFWIKVSDLALGWSA